MHIFHKYEKKEKVVTLILNKGGAEIERESLLVLETCRVCGKERGYLITQFGVKVKKAVWWIKMGFEEGIR